jgi:predicted transcriptional regulator
MATMTIRLPDSKPNRLRRLAESQGVSLNKLVEEWASMALAQFDAETRFLARAARGEVKRGLALLDRLDQAVKPSAAASKRRPARPGLRTI